MTVKTLQIVEMVTDLGEPRKHYTMTANKPKKTRKSRAEYACPHNLYLLIKIANEWSDDLKEFSEYMSQAKEDRFTFPDDFVLDDSEGEEFEELIRKGAFYMMRDLAGKYPYLHEVALRYSASVAGLSVPTELKDVFKLEIVRPLFKFYETLREEVEHLKCFAERISEVRSGQRKEFGQFKFSQIKVKTVINNKVTTLSNTFFSDATEGIEWDRLRFCAVCSNIFWAKRKDTLGCSSNCQNTLRVRRSRSLSDEEKSKRKEKRKQNRDYKQKQKAKKERK